jgi:hypothetical protein
MLGLWFELQQRGEQHGDLHAGNVLVFYSAPCTYHTITITLYISQEYSSGKEVRWFPDRGRFSERLSVIANAERREYLGVLA